MARYNLYFSGAVYPDRDPAQVRQALARMLKLDDEAVARLFSGRKVVIKRGLPASDLARYENAFKKAGAQIIVEEVEEQGANPAGLTLTPMETPPPREPEPQEPSPDPYGAPAAAVQSGQVFCRGCGQRIHERAVHCPYCGISQQSGSPRSKVVAAVLGIFLGGLGAHRLYLGQWWGVFYLFIPFVSIVAFVESIVFLATSDDRWNEKYGAVKQNLVWLVIPLIFMAVFVVGILAAVAIPAYQDYTFRSKVSASLSELEPHLDAVDNFTERTGILPDSNIMVGWEDPLVLSTGTRVALNESGAVELTFTGDSALKDKTLIMSPELESGEIRDWQCGGGTLPAKWRPSSCRNDLENAESTYQSSTSWRELTPEDGAFTASIPEHWSHLPELEDGPGEVGYGNKYREQYLIIMYEPDWEYHDDADHRVIAEAFLDNTGAFMENARHSQLETIDVGGYSATAFDLHGTIEGLEISYRNAALRTEDEVYFVLCWTLTDRFDDFRGTCNQVMESLQPGVSGVR